MSDQDKKKLKSRLSKICNLLTSSIKDPRPELSYYSSFQFLISVVLSAHTTDKIVNRCMLPYYKKGLDIDSILKMDIKKLEDIIKPVGLYKNKAQFVKQIALILHTDYKDQIPSTKEDLIKLPGVGPKTASVVLSTLFNQPWFPVDTHVFRVTKRLELHPYESKDITKVEDYILDIIDPCFLPQAHHLFLLHGRYTCKAINPQCQTCVLKKICSFNKTYTS